MCNIIKVLKSRNDLFTLQGVSKQDIKHAEEELGVKFAEDYCDLLSAFGVISYDGHEIIGICSSPRLNVTDVTRNERDKNMRVSEGMYVIEVANIDSVVIWQSSSGEIYKAAMDSQPIKLCNSLLEYINQ